MAVDIRAIVSTSLGEPISGSVNDEYVQGTGLIKCTGSVVIKGVITPAIGTTVTISYTKGGSTKQLPRKLRVLSSFADPFRRTTSVELGCKLTYLSDKRDKIDWTAFDDTENTLTEEDAAIITLPIRAQAVAEKCMAELGISGTFTLTNNFSIAKFDLSPGYVQVLGDLLVSESLCGYLDKNETLQVFSLNEEGGTGPVVGAASLVDISKIGVGQLPGEAVTVSYSSLKLKRDTPQANATDKQRNWEKVTSESIYSAPISYTVDGTSKIRVYNIIEKTETITAYLTIKTDDGQILRLPGSRTTTFSTMLPAVIGNVFSEYLSNGFTADPSKVSKTTTETYAYDGQGNETFYEKKVIGGFAFLLGSASCQIVFSPTDYVIIGTFDGSYLLERETKYTTYAGDTQQTYITTYGSWFKTIAGQQAMAAGRDSLDSSAKVAEYLNILGDTSGACVVDTRVEINTRARPVSAPQQADINNAANVTGGNPNNGYRTESKASLELALGSATAQRRIELSLPYAPDDTFYKLGTTYGSIPSDAPQKAQQYGRVQNRLLMGNRNGMSMQLPPELMPEAPFSPLVLQANGVSGLYRTNGTSWTFDAQGMVVATDALFWGGVGGSGIRWFPVAPGITELPTTPGVIDGLMTVASTVPMANETVALTATLRLRPTIEGLSYALGVSADLSFSLKLKASVTSVAIIGAPAAGVAMAAIAPSVAVGAAVAPSVAMIAVGAVAPSLTTGVSVAVPSAVVSVAGIAPDQAGRPQLQLLAPSVDVAVAGVAPAVSGGASLAVSAGGVAVAGVVPTVQATSNPISALSPVFWYDFDDASTVTLSGSTITAINDKGSRSWNLAKSATGPTQATWTNNSRKCCDWGSSAHSNYLQNTSSTSTNIAEMYIVLDAAFGSTFPDFNGLVSGTGAFAFTLCGYGATTRFYSDGSTFNSGYINGSTSDVYSTSVLPAINSPCLLRIKKSTDAALTTTTGFQIGLDRNYSGRGWLGLVAEVVCFSSVLSSSDRANVQNWLASKWGLTLV